RVGQQLALECLPAKEDSGVSWIRRDRLGTLHFIVFISHMNKATFEGSQKTSPRFEARKDTKSYQLVVKDFQPQDEGSYFCVMNSNQVLHFSPGLPAFFPGQLHLPLLSAQMPSTSCPFTSPTTPACLPKASSLPCSVPADTSREELSFFCDILIWVPLASACLLLTIALTVTIVLCQRKPR
ncbi:CD8A protein, partial [Semnornis frantzii]|nr:CD8A protein [Semnornis frantzii]